MSVNPSTYQDLSKAYNMLLRDHHDDTPAKSGWSLFRRSKTLPELFRVALQSQAKRCDIRQEVPEEGAVSVWLVRHGRKFSESEIQNIFNNFLDTANHPIGLDLEIDQAIAAKDEPPLHQWVAVTEQSFGAFYNSFVCANENQEQFKAPFRDALAAVAQEMSLAEEVPQDSVGLWIKRNCRNFTDGDFRSVLDRFIQRVGYSAELVDEMEDVLSPYKDSSELHGPETRANTEANTPKKP